jgi:hypothetical protein
MHASDRGPMTIAYCENNGSFHTKNHKIIWMIDYKSAKPLCFLGWLVTHDCSMREILVEKSSTERLRMTWSFGAFLAGFGGFRRF